MIRMLILIAGAGLGLGVLCFAVALALGGGDFARHGWRIKEGEAAFVLPAYDGHDARSETREIAWSGNDTLELDGPADVTVTQAPGPGKVVLSGPAWVVNEATLSGSRLDFDDGALAGRSRVEVTAPNVRRFKLDGDNSLTINGFDQDELDVEVSGDGRVKAAGKARAARLDISGDGDVDLSALKLADAHVDISGDGRTTIAPESSADLTISGSGEITLASHPASVRTDVSGSGRIVQEPTPAGSAKAS